MTKQELETKLKRREQYYNNTKNRLLETINEVIKIIELDKVIEDFNFEIGKIVSLFIDLNNSQWGIKNLKDKLANIKLKCCNCGADLDEEFVYCESCLDGELK